MKGVSTLVTTVMVMAVAISMVSLFSGWAPNLLGDVTDETGNQSRSQVNCNEARIGIESAVHYSSSDTTSVVVENKSQAKVGDVRVETWNNNVPLNRTSELLGKGMETVNVSGTTQEPTMVEAVSIECSNAKDTSTEIKAP